MQNGDRVETPQPAERERKWTDCPLDTCRGVMRAYELYLYDLYKERYENNVNSDE